MDRAVTAVARSIACETRLRVLSHIAQHGESTPSALADTFHLTRNLVSIHLRRLSAAALICQRRAGAWCYCTVQSPDDRNALSGQTAAFLADALRDPVAAASLLGLNELQGMPPDEARTAFHALLFDAATAFTDLRRLQILRYIRGHGAAITADLMSRLHMSAPAAMRHTDKLLRRGYLTVTAARRNRMFRIATRFKTPVHARLFEIVSAEWDRTEQTHL